jgi:hypothetical protein
MEVPEGVEPTVRDIQVMEDRPQLREADLVCGKYSVIRDDDRQRPFTSAHEDRGAGVVAFVATADFATGQTIVVNGGRSLV